MSILDKKLSEVTVDELLAHLGIDKDLARQARERTKQASDEAGELVERTGMLQHLYSHSTVMVFSNAADLHKWYLRECGRMANDPSPKKLLLIWAWEHQ